MQVSSGYGTGQYASKPSNKGYLAALTTDRGSSTQFYIASNGWLTPYPDHTAYNYIVIPVDNGGGTIFIQASDSRDPSRFGGSGAVSCVSLPPTGGPLSCQVVEGGGQFQWCGDSGGPEEIGGVVLGPSVYAGCQAQTYDAVPVCVVNT
ncbi:hypothetical protein LTS18_005962 [Coniosporium uncinatum]|uniref:Uncharacterized protein n=1 Tax=Coniosporium uncinatum TaxID=93489 RepID=A0ACC3DQY7_9PEZI|nr:hypothetical protein LTS18_005962 [Coniosporium uncinatum]